jgi:hypothetical protein
VAKNAGGGPLVLGTLIYKEVKFNPLNTELHHIFHLLILLGAHLILHISRIRGNLGRSQVRKREKIGVNQPLTYMHPFTPTLTLFKNYPLFNSVKKNLK